MRNKALTTPEWAVVLAMGVREDYWISTFVSTEDEARQLMEESKAPEHGFTLHLYRLVE